MICILHIYLYFLFLRPVTDSDIKACSILLNIGLYGDVGVNGYIYNLFIQLTGYLIGYIKAVQLITASIAYGKPYTVLTYRGYHAKDIETTPYVRTISYCLT